MGVSGKGYEVRHTVCTFRLTKKEKNELVKLCEQTNRTISDLLREGIKELKKIYCSNENGDVNIDHLQGIFQ